jgi:hypothetical protein
METSMDIIGLSAAVLGVEDIDASTRYCADFGLTPIDSGSNGLNAEASDGTQLIIRAATDTSLPASIAPPPNLRETVWAVREKSVIDAIGAELGKDRQVKLGSDGVLHSYDESGYPIAFQPSCRRPYKAEPVLINVAGFPPQRAPNQVACDPRRRSSRAHSPTSSISYRISRTRSGSMWSGSASLSPTASLAPAPFCGLPEPPNIIRCF